MDQGIERLAVVPTQEGLLTGRGPALLLCELKIHERYRIIGALCEGATAAAASRMVGCSGGKAEHWVHRFNASGFTTFEKQPNHRGRAIIIDGQQVRALIGVALSRPQDLRLPFTQWSVSKLRSYCLKEGLIEGRRGLRS